MRLGIGSALRAAMLVLSIGLVWNGFGCAGGDKEQAGDEMTGGEDSGSAEDGSDKKKKKKAKKKKAKKAK